MTPLEIHDYKLSWRPGYSVRIHSDIEGRAKSWAKRQLEKHQWYIMKWTNVYEHTFHFEDIRAAQNFEMEMHPYANP